MPSRVRTRPSTATIVTSPNGQISTISQLSEYFADSFSTIKSVRPWNACAHFRSTIPYDGPYRRRQQYSWHPIFNDTVTNYISQAPIYVLSHMLQSAILADPILLDFQKNNDFEILNFFGEIDEFLEIFTKRFLTSLYEQGNYATFTWAIAPLISDLKGLVASYQDIFNDRIVQAIDKFRSSSTFSKSCSFTFDGSTYNPAFKSKFTGVVRYHGITMLSNFDANTAIQIFLDEIGFHPDLRTVWDLLPFSFVLDYLVPVGNLLEGLSPRGWFRPKYTLDGYLSFTGEAFTQELAVTYNSMNWKYANYCTSDVYFRSDKISSIVGEVNPSLDWKGMSDFSFREQFNVWWLGINNLPPRQVKRNRFVDFMLRANDVFGMYQFVAPSLLKEFS